MEHEEMPIGVKFAVIHRAFRRELDAVLREKDLTGAQFGALRAIDHLERSRDGEISQRDVEQISHSTHPTMTEILKKLEKKGFIETRPSEIDRRRKLLCQTEKARELSRAMSRVDEETYAKFCAGLNAAQASSLENMLDILLKNACSSFEKEE